MELSEHGLAVLLVAAALVRALPLILAVLGAVLPRSVSRRRSGLQALEILRSVKTRKPK